MQIRIFLYRSFDQKHSDSSVGFSYVTHSEFNDELCPFCLIRGRISNSTAFLSPTKNQNGYSRKRPKHSFVPRASPLALSPLSDLSSVVSSPSSSCAFSSPQYTPGNNEIPDWNECSENCCFEGLKLTSSGDVQTSDSFLTQEPMLTNNTNFEMNQNFYKSDQLSLADLSNQETDFSNLTLHFEWDNETSTLKSSVVADSFLTSKIDSNMMKSNLPEVDTVCVSEEADTSLKLKNTNLFEIATFVVIVYFAFSYFNNLVGMYY